MGLKVGITGASGLIGAAVAASLRDEGQEVVALPRPTLANQPLPPALDAVVHLAGEPIASGRWTSAKKRAIRDSRVEGTRRLVEKLAQSESRPEVLVCASAVGYYGDRGAEPLDEQSSRGQGFLADVAAEWEAAAHQAESLGVRVVSLRFGMVLSRDGGALAAMRLPFLLGLGGPVGNGQQYWSWISLRDAVGAVQHAIMHDNLAGPVNAVAPDAVQNRDFAALLAKQLRRPCLLRVPAWAARLALGELADALLLASLRVTPRVLLETGYRFRDANLADALQQCLEKQAK